MEFRLQDYRHVEGRFDKIVSIEMLEAVGHENLGTYFATCDRLLAEDGLVALQVITVPDHDYDTYRKSCDFIQKVIFPGSLVPCLSALTEAIARNSELMVESVENIGIHYARTLGEWRDRFRANWEEIEQAGFDERFRRIWEYYLGYCEGGFATRTLGDLHLVLTRVNNQNLPEFSHV